MKKVHPGHRLRAGVVQVHRKVHTKRYWISMGVIAVCVTVVIVSLIVGVHDGTIHHIAVGVLAERLAGLHLSGGE